MDWIIDAYPLGYCVTFAKNIDANEILARLGGNMAATEWLTVEEAERKELTDPRRLPIARAGVHREWAFAIESWGAHGDRLDVARRVSEGTESVAISRTAKPTDFFTYSKHGDILCRFDAGMPRFRRGSDPDVISEEMRNAGLVDMDDAPSPSGAVLRLAQSAFGITLPKPLVVDVRLISAQLAE